MPAHDKTYNKTCVTNKDRSACAYTQFGKGLIYPSLDSPVAVEGMRSGKTDQTSRMHRLI